MRDADSPARARELLGYGVAVQVADVEAVVVVVQQWSSVGDGDNGGWCCGPTRGSRHQKEAAPVCALSMFAPYVDFSGICSVSGVGRLFKTVQLTSAQFPSGAVASNSDAGEHKLQWLPSLAWGKADKRHAVPQRDSDLGNSR